MSNETHLPPMKSLIVAESVSRNGAVTKAADELCISSSAVSQQLRVLEGAMKITFFKRGNGKISVKSEYRSYFEQVGRSLSQIKLAGENLKQSEQFTTLTVSVVPSFLSLCLLNSLHDFMAKHPTMKLNFLSNLVMVNFDTDNVDLSIRYTANTSDSSLVYEKIRDDYLIPCATKSLVEKVGGDDINFFIKDSYLIEDISKPLLEQKPNWDNWFDNSLLSIDRFLGFTDYSSVLHAGLQDMGAFIARTGLMIDPKYDDRLIPLADNYQKSDASLYIVYSAHIPLKPQARILKSWILHNFSESLE